MALDYTVIGKRIRKYRLQKNITQEMLAEKLNVSVAFISRIERGTTHLNLKRLNEICNILDITEGTLLDGAGIESKSYLSTEFEELLKNCPKGKQKLIYDIAKLIIEDKN